MELRRITHYMNTTAKLADVTVVQLNLSIAPNSKHIEYTSLTCLFSLFPFST